MKVVWYLLDNNVLAKLSRTQREGTFLRDHCRIPSEVLHEARFLPHARLLSELEYPVTVGVLERLQQVMASVPPGDHKLVDLYRNTGNADPLLIACALDARSRSQETLWEEDWRIVTDDHALSAKASDFGITTLKFREFAALLQGPEPGTRHRD